MKRLRHYIFIILFLLPLCAESAETYLPVDPATLNVDSIVKEAISLSHYYEHIVEDYHAEVYMKNKTFVRKRNYLLRYLPSMYRIKKDRREYIIETYSDVHFSAPNIHDQRITAVSGTVDRFRPGSSQLLEYFNVNIYSSSLLKNKLVSPLSGSAPKYYSYKLDSVVDFKGHKAYCISFKPEKVSFQLVEGYMIISDETFSVRRMQFTGRSEYLHFDNLIEMGDLGAENEFLPVSFHLNVTFSMLGNKLDSSYFTVFKYNSIELAESILDVEKKKLYEINYDLTESYSLQCDTTSFIRDTAYFAQLRPVPLTANEKSIYDNYFQSKDTLLHIEAPKSRSMEFWGGVGDVLISDYTINIADVGSVRASPLLNPLLIDYSGSRGWSYKQEFKYNRILKGDRLLRVVPRIGYNFTYKELYYSINSDFHYWPRKRASLHLRMGNGNRIYSSDVLDDLRQMPDSLFDFDRFRLTYFKDFFVDLRHSQELTNGLVLDVGVAVHKRTAVDRSDFFPVSPPTYFSTQPPAVIPAPEADPEIMDKLRDAYVSFAPRVRLSWTPGQYYYMSGDRKVNLHSRYPTFSLDWERGIPGVFSSTGKYERLEFDMQHQIPLGLMRNIYYRTGFGLFTNQSQLYFVDFANFSRSNLPIGWNDDIGGVFQLLDRRWYNASRKYLRGNVTYEAPFLLIPRLKKYTRYILNERIYAGVLVMPHLNPYIELGYGIGTHIFDVGIFVSNVNGKFNEVGFKFTFELFNR